MSSKLTPSTPVLAIVFLIAELCATRIALSEMVLIPAGEFQMGSKEAEAGRDEQPVHTVHLDAFYIDKYEVTNAEYAAFLNVKGKHIEGEIKLFDLNDSDARIEYVNNHWC